MLRSEGFCVQAKMRKEVQWPERISSNVTIKQEHNETICVTVHYVYTCHFNTLKSCDLVILQFAQEKKLGSSFLKMC